jgi:hypothetical protein
MYQPQQQQQRLPPQQATLIDFTIDQKILQGSLHPQDIDMHAREFLRTVPPQLAIRAVEEMSKKDMSQVSAVC